MKQVVASAGNISNPVEGHSGLKAVVSCTNPPEQVKGAAPEVLGDVRVSVLPWLTRFCTSWGLLRFGCAWSRWRSLQPPLFRDGGVSAFVHAVSAFGPDISFLVRLFYKFSGVAAGCI